MFSQSNGTQCTLLDDSHKAYGTVSQNFVFENMIILWGQLS